MLTHNKFAAEKIDNTGDCKAIKDAYDLIAMAAAAKGCDFTFTGKLRFCNVNFESLPFLFSLVFLFCPLCLVFSCPADSSIGDLVTQ